MIIKNREINHKLLVEQLKEPLREDKPFAEKVATQSLINNTQLAEKAVLELPDPYTEQPLGPDVFEQGKLIDRREPSDRRTAFRRESDELFLSTVEKEAQKIKERAQQEGFENGLDKAQQEIEQLKTVVEEFVGLREQVLEQAVAEIAGMATEVAKKILKAELQTNPESVVDFVRHAITGAGKKQKFVTVRLHPSDLPIVDKAFQSKSPVSESVDLTLLEDVSVDPGSCIIETQAGQIDKRFSTQLDVLARLMQKEGLV